MRKIIATNKTLKDIINQEIKKYGINADLNHIDTSNVTDMHYMFNESKFNGDISEWDVSNANGMHCMFYGSQFNGDISKWDVSNVIDMSLMFCSSQFNGDISKWDVSNVTDMHYMFYQSKFNGDVSGWDTSKLKWGKEHIKEYFYRELKMTIKYSKMQVKLIDRMGSDWSVVNDARVSFSGFNENNNQLPYSYSEEKAMKLINYLATHEHTSPFRHCYLKLKCKAPLFIARQLAKHQVGLSWNEESRRYIDSEPEFYRFESWRKRPENNIKQGSLCALEYQHFPEELVEKTMLSSINVYNKLLEIHVAPEQARAILPQNIMINWVWSGTLLAFVHMCNLRSHESAQKESQDFAKLVAEEIKCLFPSSFAALNK